MKKGLLVGILLLFIALPCAVQVAPEGELEEAVPFHLPRTRWSEDWSVLEDPEHAYDSIWRPIKFIELGEGGKSHLSIGGEARLTYERYEPGNRGLSDPSTEDVGLLRLAVHTDWHLGPRWRIFGQLGSAFAGDREGGNKQVDESQLDIWQLFVEHSIELEGERTVMIRLGRQIIETANTFITAGEANNLRLYHQGLRAAFKVGEFMAADAFVAEAVDYAYGAFDMRGNGEYLWGARVGKRYEESGLQVNVLYLGWDLMARNFEQGAPGGSDEMRHTLMLWANRPITVEHRLGLDYYLAYQFGTYDDRPGGSDIAAFAAYGGFEYALIPAVKTPIVGLKTSYFSGDEDRDDNELNTFYDPIFGTPYFSWARNVMPFNLLHLQPSMGVRFSESFRLTLSQDFLWRESKGDGFYTDANSLGIRADASDARYIGTQAQLALRWTPTRHITTLAHLVHFWAGDFVEDGGGEDQIYFHCGLTYLF